MAVAVPNTDHRRILGINIFATHHPVADLYQGCAAMFLIPEAVTAACFRLLDKGMFRHGGHNDNLNFWIRLFDFCCGSQPGFFIGSADIHQDQINPSTKTGNFCIRRIFYGGVQHIFFRFDNMVLDGVPGNPGIFYN